MPVGWNRENRVSGFVGNKGALNLALNGQGEDSEEIKPGCISLKDKTK